MPAAPSTKAGKYREYNAGALLAADGGVVLSGVGAITPPAGFSCFFAIHACFGEDLVIAAATMGSNWTGSIATRTIPAGQLVMVEFTSITLTSGSGVAYPA